MNKFIVICCAFLLTITSEAAVRTAQQAAQLAAQFTNAQPVLSKMHKTARGTSDMSLVHTFNKPSSAEAAVYVFNQEDNKGFVMVSADDQTMDILCYSDEGSFDIATANPNFLWWISRYTQEVAHVDDSNAYNAGSAASKSALAATTSIAPLLGNIAWDQEEPYNNLCPMDLYYTNERCYTGCVATAAAQIMRMWQYPEKGTGAHSYTWKSYNEAGTNYKSQILSLAFDTITFDWDNMRETYGTSTSSYTKAEGKAVATLMYACGIACDMIYGGYTAGGSGAWTDEMGYGLVTYFGYKNTAKFISTYSKSKYEGFTCKGGACAMANAGWSQTIAELTTAFNAELEAGRPILMGGESLSDGGHEFVCDGRDSSGKFHINWGWSGKSNCYVALSALKPTGVTYSFSDEVDAIIGLEPGIVDTIHVTGVTVDPKADTIKINGKTQLNATVLPADATDKTVTWTSSDTTVATVSATGIVRGIAAGKATIMVTTNDSCFKDSTEINVSKEVEPVHSFELVTDAKDLIAGEEILLVNRESGNAVSTTQNTSNRGVAAVNINDDAIDLEDGQTEVQIFTLKAGMASGQWAFYTNEGYLYAGSSTKNQLKTEATLDENGSFNISITEGDAVVKAQGSNTRNVLRYNENNGSPVFSCYSSTAALYGTVSIFSRSAATGVGLVQGSKFQDQGSNCQVQSARRYNLSGQLVGDNYKGIVIINGKKLIK